VTCDTTVVIDALEGTRPAAVELFAHARAGEIDVAFATRLQHELQRHTLDEVRELVGVPPIMLTTTGRYDVSTYGGGDTYGTEIGPSELNLIPTSWRLGLAHLGMDTFLGGAPADVSNPTMDAVGKLRTFDSDHLEAHRRSGRTVFVTSDATLLKAAHERGFDAITPEVLMTRLHWKSR
jgi:hypothetical protein